MKLIVAAFVACFVFVLTVPADLASAAAAPETAETIVVAEKDKPKKSKDKPGKDQDPDDGDNGKGNDDKSKPGDPTGRQPKK